MTLPFWTEILREREFKSYSALDILQFMLVGGLDTKDIASVFSVNESDVWGRVASRDGEKRGSFRDQKSIEFTGGIIGPALLAAGSPAGSGVGLQRAKQSNRWRDFGLYQRGKKRRRRILERGGVERWEYY